ncbi:hypothetical protein Taro_028539, partial [Colocasia esculenta]|nr:hypothetical protein [Colocasia esculenta]
TRLDLLVEQHRCNHELLLFFSFFFPWRRCSAPLDADSFFPLFLPSPRMLLAFSCVGCFGVPKTWPECVDTTTECVDTLSQLSKKGLLEAGSSVDTTRDCVDTLSQSGNWVSWELGLVSTVPGAVSTH